MDSLRQKIRSHPIIDNHAHNLLLPSQQNSRPFLSITSEAQGGALKDSRFSLANIRARKQLKRLYGVDEDDWDSILAARERSLSHRDELIDKCLMGTHTILMDDGLDSDTVHHYSWHDKYLIGDTRRIVRIESVAEAIMKQQILPKYKQQHTIEDLKDFKLVEKFLENLGHTFHDSIRDYTNDKCVAGFKSVICYRSGLSVNIEEHTESEIDDLVAAFATWFRRCLRGETTKVNSKILNDWLVSITMFILSGTADTGHPKPIQFHTGFGDNDLTLFLANPTHMQALIEKFPRVPIILLHTSYPFTREAGYLAAVYKNVFLDLGLAFPMLSRTGQENVLRQCLELVPTNKILWSTDGHWFPETFWLANVQFREVLEKVLVESVQAGDLNVDEATHIAKDILFDNANRVYHLRIRLTSYPNHGAHTSTGSLSSADNVPSRVETEPSKSSDAALLEEVSRQNPNLAFVYVQWLDYMGTMRVRLLPIAEFRELAKAGKTIGISRGNTGTLQNDTLTPAVNTTGQIYVKSDMSSLRPTHHLDTLRKSSSQLSQRSSATVMASWCDESGAALDACPRSRLQQIPRDIENEFGLYVLLGCEIEVTFMKRNTGGIAFEPYTQNHAWGSLTPEQWGKLDLLRDICDGLATMGVEVQQIHAESSPGQYEFILPPLSPLEAIDTLIACRAAIRQIAHTHSVLATFHPSPLPGNNTAAHLHISLNTCVDEQAGEGGGVPRVGALTLAKSNAAFFRQGILKHLRAVTAFTMPAKESYERVRDGAWTGGTWVAWGTQNREVPLRKIDGASERWEVRCVDGMGNAYLAATAILGAGLLGLRDGIIEKEEVGQADCAENPSMLSDAQRAALGIIERLPRTLEESLQALQLDRGMKTILGEKLVEDYVVMKGTEQRMLGNMSDEERHVWLVERY